MSVNPINSSPSTELKPVNPIGADYLSPVGIPLSVTPAPTLESGVSLSKPKLQRPELLILDLHARQKKLSDRALGLSLKKIKEENLTLEKLISSQISTHTDLANSESEAYTWGVVKNLGTSIMAVFQMVFGSYLLSTAGGAAAGSTLIASAMLALANTALSEKGGWNWIAECLEEQNKEKQEMIAIILPVIVATISIGLSLAGFAQAAQVQNIDGLTDLLNRGIQIITAGGTLGAAYGENKVLKAQIQALGLEKGMTLSEKHISLLSSAFEELMREFERSSTTVKKMIKQSIYESRAVTMA